MFPLVLALDRRVLVRMDLDGVWAPGESRLYANYRIARSGPGLHRVSPGQKQRNYRRSTVSGVGLERFSRHTKNNPAGYTSSFDKDRKESHRAEVPGHFGQNCAARERGKVPANERPI